MTEELKTLQSKAKRNARISTTFLIASMGIMALWGWTPLKELIPALYTLVAFLMCLIVSTAFAVITTIQGMKAKHMKAKIEDQ